MTKALQENPQQAAAAVKQQAEKLSRSTMTETEKVAQLKGYVEAIQATQESAETKNDLLVTVVKSFERFPADGNFLQALGQMRIYELGTSLFASALWIALPMIALLLFVNLTLGIISRVAPQMNIYAVGFPVTLTVGLTGLMATLPLLEQPLVALLQRGIAVFGT